MEGKGPFFKKNKILFFKKRKKILINIVSDYIKNEFNNLFSLIFNAFNNNFYLAFKKTLFYVEKQGSKFLIFVIIAITFVDIIGGNEKLSIIVEDFKLPSIFNEEFSILKGKKLLGSFIAQENNLGILSFKFKTSKNVVDDILIFRIKESGSNNFWYENQYPVRIIRNGIFFPFGFPLIKDSSGKKIEFEIESLNGKNDNCIIADLKYPIRAKYYFDKSIFFKEKKSLLNFAEKKIKNLIKYANYKIFFIFYLPFLLGTVFLCLKGFFSFLFFFFYSFAFSIIALNKIQGESFYPLSLQLISNRYFFIFISIIVFFILLKELLKSSSKKVVNIPSKNHDSFTFRLNFFGKNILIKRLDIIFFAFLLLFLFIKNLIFIEKIKFFDSDEVRLLYDASLINSGFIPYIDFASRAPLLIYFLSVFTKFGIRNIYFYYLMSSLMIMFSAFFLFKITDEIFNKKVAFLTLFSFLINPMLINMIYIKTQTYSIPLVLLSTFLFIKYKKDKKRFYLILSLSTLGAAILIRESSVFVLLPIFWFDYVFERTSIIRKIIGWGKISLTSVLPYLFFQLLVFANSGYRNLPLPNKSFFIGKEKLSQLLILPNYLSPLFVAIIFSTSIYLVFILFQNRKNNLKYLFPIMALISLSVLYFYELLRHGFWPEYILEFLPYLSMIMGLFLYFLAEEKREKLILMIITLLVSIALPQEIFRRSFGIFPIEPIIREIIPIIDNSGKKIEILAGSPIYAFLSANDNVLHYSHLYYDDKSISKIIEKSLITPPQFIIKDPYWTVFSAKGREEMEKLLSEKYVSIRTINSLIDGKWTNFEIFVLKNK